MSTSIARKDEADRLAEMDRRADEVIRNWSFGAVGANLLPPPYDMLAVTAAIARMGTRLGSVYEIEISDAKAKMLARGIAKGLAAAGVLSAAYAGTSMFKYVPGVNLWVALLVQPPLVGALSYSAGHAFKQYFRAARNGETLTPDDLARIAENKVRERLRTVKRAKLRR